MNIGVDARELRRGQMTGIGRFLRNLLSGLLKLDSDNRYFLFGFRDLDFQADARNLTTVLRDGTVTLFWDQVYLPSAIKAHKIDVFFSPYYKVPLLAPCGVVLTHHDFTMFSYPEYKKRVLYNAALKAAMLVFNKKARRIICDSEFTRREMHGYFDLPAEKAVLITESAGAGFAPCGAERIEVVRKRYKLEKRYLLYVGNSYPHKNVEGLVRAYGLLPAEQRGKYDLALAGVAPSFCAAEGVRGLGHVADGELAALYCGAELFVFPSFMEGFGLPPLEAMACGCPVISSSADCMPEVLGDACLYFDPGDTGGMSSMIARVLNDGEVRAGLRRKGAARAEFYASKNTAAELLEIFKSACRV